jgi:hypothetical protein
MQKRYHQYEMRFARTIINADRPKRYRKINKIILVPYYRDVPKKGEINHGTAYLKSHHG